MTIADRGRAILGARVFALEGQGARREGEARAGDVQPAAVITRRRH